MNTRLADTRSYATVALVSSLLAVAMISGCKSTVDDSTLTANVKAAIAADSTVSQQPVQVGVQSGVVTLTGNVSDETASAVVAGDAAKVKGVKEVVNSMQVAGVQVAPTIVSPAAPTVARQTTQAERTAIAQGQPLVPPGGASAPAISGPVAPPPPPEPVYHDVTVAAGTLVPVRITETLDSAVTQPGASFTGVLTHEIEKNGLTLIPAGSGVSGRVVAVHDAGHFKGHSLLSVELTAVNHHGHSIPISTEAYTLEGKNRGTNSAEKIGGGAAVGAILGGILGHGKGAAIGAAAGAGGGAAVQGLTRGQQVSIPSESVVRFHLSNSFTVRTTGSSASAEPSAPALRTR